MSDKRKTIQSELVSKEEVLRELGNPAEWFALSRSVQFKSHLCRGQSDLDITGISGRQTEDSKGYLGWLKAELAYPIGSNTGLVSDGESAKIAAASRATIAAEIEKYEARLEVLERDPDAVHGHIAALESWLAFLGKFGPMDPDDQPTEELVELAKQDVIDRAKEVEDLRSEIKRYTALLATLA